MRTRGDELFCWIEIGRQKRGIQVALHRPDAAWALVKPRRVRLIDERPASVAKLGQFRGTCVECEGTRVQGAARAGHGASEVCDQHPWGTTRPTLLP